MLYEASAWAFGWDALVAIGTLGLAAVTVFLARAARQEIGVAKREVQGAIRPIIVDVPEQPDLPASVVDFTALGREGRASASPGGIAERWLSDHECLVAIPVRNVGSGPALIAAPHPSLRPHNQAARQGRANALAVPAGETAHLLFHVDAVPEQGGLVRGAVTTTLKSPTPTSPASS